MENAMRKNKLALALLFSFVAGSALAADKVNWSYEGSTGPAHWGELSQEFAVCKTG